MLITIHDCDDKHYVQIGSKDNRFSTEWGSVVRVSKNSLYEDLGSIANWCNNTLKEECLFELD